MTRPATWKADRMEMAVFSADLEAKGHCITGEGGPRMRRGDRYVVLSDEDIERIAWRVVALLELPRERRRD